MVQDDVNKKLLFNGMKFNNRKGQSILESTVAIYIAIVGLMSIMNIVFYNIQSQGLSHSMLIASNLAREGIEEVRNLRDSNWLNSKRNWDEGLLFAGDPSYPSPPHNDGNSFLVWNTFYKNDFSFHTYSYGGDWEKCTQFDENFNAIPCRVYILPNINDQNFLTYSLFGNLVKLSKETKFYKLIYINEICLNKDGQEFILSSFDKHCADNSRGEKIGLQVISRVGWDDKENIKDVLVEERLYNWK
ncbi:hypothetical protein K8R66_04735 [bacterium]|nr:hypothetical protein [bacterium]